MEYLPKSLRELALELGKLPSIGPKSAMRLAYYIISLSQDDAKHMAEAIVSANKNIKNCNICGNICENDLCTICENGKRDKNIICVVTNSRDISAIEKTNEFNGVYHVLGGSISPISGIGPDDINIKGLIVRLNEINEVIIATNTDVEGEATAIYIAKLIKPFDIKVSRIAYGVPVGGNLEYTDEITILRALENRKQI